MREPARRDTSSSRAEPQRDKHKDYACTICEKKRSFCWSCPCGFMICSDCMEENAWGLTCNNITWECPDCGSIRSF